MLFKVYNQNGKVKVTKIAGYVEQTMFSNLADGEVAEIEVGVSQYTKSHKKKNDETAPEVDSAIPTVVMQAMREADKLKRTREIIDFAVASGALDPEEGRRARLVMENSVYGLTGKGEENE